MQKTKIEWTDYTWNPIKGLCPVGCWYCYARKMYKRFGWNPKIRIADEFPGMIFMPLYDRKREVIKRKVFVCSTFELFHPLVKKQWRDWIFDIIEYNNNLTFQILTKFPQNIDRPMPDNVWLGTTVTDDGDMINTWRLRDHYAKIKFISIEPIFEHIDSWMIHHSCKWIIVGRLTGYGKKHQPKREWINELVIKARDRRIPIFLKNNLKEIWGKPLIQEFPE